MKACAHISHHDRRPVVTFLIGLAQGQRFEGVELAGASLVLVALVANNLYLRHRTAEA